MRASANGILHVTKNYWAKDLKNSEEHLYHSFGMKVTSLLMIEMLQWYIHHIPSSLFVQTKSILTRSKFAGFQPIYPSSIHRLLKAPHPPSRKVENIDCEAPSRQGLDPDGCHTVAGLVKVEDLSETNVSNMCKKMLWYCCDIFCGSSRTKRLKTTVKWP